MKNKLLFLFLLIVFSVIPFVITAEGGGGFFPDPQDPNYYQELTKNTPVLERGDLIAIIFRLIQYLLMFLGVVAMIIILYGGYTWMTAGGNDEKVGKAKKILMAGLIGLVIILLAFAIAAFIINRIHDFSAIKSSATFIINNFEI